MPRTQQIAIVTDSFACYGGFSGHSSARVTVASNGITIGSRRFRDGIDLDPSEAIRLLAQQPTAPAVLAPSPSEYGQIYAQLAHAADAIISIHTSREISQSWANAKAGALQVSHCPIAIIDSRTVSAGQAMLVRLAMDAVEQQMTFDDITKLLRAAVERIYCLFYVESLDYLLQNSILEPGHAVISSMMNVRPLITVENGRLHTMEKVRSRTHAIDRMIEFAIEFMDISDAVLLQPRAGLTETGRLLQERLREEVQNWHYPSSAYGLSLAALVGTDMTGLVILENELENPT
jgi:DegV family protein with EDD domain